MAKNYMLGVTRRLGILVRIVLQRWDLFAEVLGVGTGILRTADPLRCATRFRTFST